MIVMRFIHVRSERGSGLEECAGLEKNRIERRLLIMIIWAWEFHPIRSGYRVEPVTVPVLPVPYVPSAFPGLPGYCMPLHDRCSRQALIWNTDRRAGYLQYPETKNQRSNTFPVKRFMLESHFTYIKTKTLFKLEFQSNLTS